VLHTSVLETEVDPFLFGKGSAMHWKTGKGSKN